MAMQEKSAAAVMKLVEDQLTEERSTKASLESRAFAVITTSGTLATLMLALPALVMKKADTYTLPGAARAMMIIALIAFVAAAIQAIAVARPESYQEVHVDSLRDAATRDALNAPADEGDASIAHVLIDMIQKARVKNGRKAVLLRRAVTTEVAATILLAAAVALVLLLS